MIYEVNDNLERVRKCKGTLFGRCDHGIIDLSQPET
jgi:hypothetical protein